MAATGPLVYTREEAARLARMGLSTFDQQLKKKRFPSIRVGRRVLIPADEFRRALTEVS